MRSIFLAVAVALLFSTCFGCVYIDRHHHDRDGYGDRDRRDYDDRDRRDRDRDDKR